MSHSIPGKMARIKGILSNDLFSILLVILVGFAGFGLGRLSVQDEQRQPVHIERGNNIGQIIEAENVSATVPQQGGFVASRNGSRYHFPWCSGAKRIKPENEVWFSTREDAERAGYTPAQNCKGL